MANYMSKHHSSNNDAFNRLDKGTKEAVKNVHAKARGQSEHKAAAKKFNSTAIARPKGFKTFW